VKLQILTKFDITNTGTQGSFNANRLPFRDRSGQQVGDLQSWHRSRNRQRNWETINQLIALRTLPYSITDPVLITDNEANRWCFEFEFDNAGAFAHGEDTTGALKHDCEKVPMLIGLAEDPGMESHLLVGTNIWFDILENK
jgi:hypothetical protein